MFIPGIENPGGSVGEVPTLQRSIPFYFTIQFQHLGFSNFVSLLTLCLAPLGFHIVGGAPDPVVLDREHPPGWKYRIYHLNPTSIYWRYYNITLRWARAKTWTDTELAPANAIFWVGGEKKWNGSEDMVLPTKTLITKEASKYPVRDRVLSTATLNTLVITFQGIQSLVGVVKGRPLGRYALAVALPNVFQPLAIAGLFRLLCSVWLCNDYYSNIDEKKLKAFVDSKLRALQRTTALSPAQLMTLPPLQSQQETALASAESTGLSPPQSRQETELEPTESTSLPPLQYQLAFGVKVFFLFTTGSLLGLSLSYFKPNSRITAGTASTLGVNLLYTIFLLFTFFTAVIYTMKGQTNTTIIPCINSRWYKAYTYLLFGSAFLITIFVALETRMTACGQFTTYPAWLNYDYLLC